MGTFDNEQLLYNVISTTFQSMHCVWKQFVVEITLSRVLDWIDTFTAWLEIVHNKNKSVMK